MRVRMSVTCINLVHDVYPDLEDRVDIEVAIEQHLLLLNRDERFDEAADFLQRTEKALREEFARKQKEKGRENIWMVVRSSLPAFMLVAAKIFTDHSPFG